MIKPLKHTNMEMDTVVTIVLSHNDTSKVAVRGGEGGAHRHKYCHRPIVSLLKEKTDKLRTLKHTAAAAYVYCSRAKDRDAMTWLWMGTVCKREGRG